MANKTCKKNQPQTLYGRNQLRVTLPVSIHDDSCRASAGKHICFEFKTYTFCRRSIYVFLRHLPLPVLLREMLKVKICSKFLVKM